MSLLHEIRRQWKPRPAASHKGDFGRVFILAGSKGLTGAATLASAASIRSGAGLVTLGVPEAVYPVLARRHAEVMVKPFPATRRGSLAFRGLRSIVHFAKTQDVLALGPGLSQDPETQKLIRKVVAGTDLPLVLDADGLNAFKGHLKELKPCRGRAVLTPHPGEFRRLFGGRLSHQDIERKRRALEVAKKFGFILVLKGHRTVAVSPDGKVYVNTTGNPGMAAGGTGDVLTGMIAALLGQRFSSFDAARFSVYLHGLAGDLAAKKVGPISLTASDLLQFLPAAFKQVL